ncbi:MULTISPECIES: hypothetical protein [unclassified Mesorhizobium]|uniref:hypothetical protein n=1 Tax=unclassified Mesorhizobium TaxID=325217 RepID=UPI0003CE4479|nr:MULTISPECIES: hypothetical protein [unclassified Mesorhizobium]ESY02904.1 hypothetical protein X753_22920 [Mesorhizobium sp. LNJC399B00]WJI69162.1 hypothetical protein NLY36_31085 [Mesorhizobium sp. C399B]
MIGTSSFDEALHSDGPNPGLAEKLDLYGRFVGAWTFDATRHLEDGTVLTGRGEVHFGWVLEGRAIQDVWILPARDAGPSPSVGRWTFYGTTLRAYDPGSDAWHIFWSDPRNQYYSRQLGRAEGDTIVQVGADGTGSSVRWSFSRITKDSFRWLGERSHDDGKTWRLEVEFLARRVAQD